MNPAVGTGVVAPRPTRPRKYGRVTRAGLVATPVAVAATTSVAAAARALGVDLAVEGSDQTIPLPGVAVMTGVFSLVGVVLAAVLLRWSARPADRFVGTTVSLTALSLVPPVFAAADAAIAVTLVCLHLVAAAVVIPVLTRGLRPDTPASMRTRCPYAGTRGRLA